MSKKIKRWIFLFLFLIGILFIRSSCNHEEECVPNYNFKYGTIKDIDGNPYKTITIGSQTWMAENLKVTRYRNGDTIPQIMDDTLWSKIESGAYAILYNANKVGLGNGNLYNWYAVHDSRNIAPAGWHIPTVDEWNTLVYYLGKDYNKLREGCTVHWVCPYGNNNSGFTALPSGCRTINGDFGGDGGAAYWWSSIESSYNESQRFIVSCDGNGLDNRDKHYGFSVRCIKDK